MKVICIASGKGGVGKSSISIGLALALKKRGKKVGVLDLDLQSPSVAIMTGTLGVELNASDRVKPVDRNGVKIFSMDYLIPEGAAILWKGNEIENWIPDFFKIDWGDLDILIVDLPPGMIPHEISGLKKSVNIEGVVLVTTPQDVALASVKKMIFSCKEYGLPVIGIIENMSGYKCPKCGEVVEIFRSGGGERLAKSVGIPMISSIPLNPMVCYEGDDGSSKTMSEMLESSGAVDKILKIIEGEVK
ncbi:MAG: P-loop NTPase [Nitrososphaerales archaeon]